jgi:hypothetical protein
MNKQIKAIYGALKDFQSIMETENRLCILTMDILDVEHEDNIQIDCIVDDVVLTIISERDNMLFIYKRQPERDIVNAKIRIETTRQRIKSFEIDNNRSRFRPVINGLILGEC